MEKEYDDKEIDDDDVDENSDEDDEEEEDDDEIEETYLGSQIKEVIDMHEDIVNAYVMNPDTPQELSENESTKKFIVHKVRKRLLDSFESQQQWSEDELLIGMVKKCKKDMSKDADLNALTAMKRIIKNE